MTIRPWVLIHLSCAILVLLSGCAFPSIRIGTGSLANDSETAPPLDGSGMEFSVELTENTINNTGITLTAPEPTREEAKKEATIQKIRRQNFRAVIQKGDYFFVKEDREAALIYYLDAYQKLSSDHIIEAKIGRVYFGMKKFIRAYDYFRRIPASVMSARDKELLLLSLLSIRNERIISELTRLGIRTDEREYYRSMFVCLAGIHQCVDTLSSYTGSFALLSGLRDILADSTTITPDIAYRNVRLAGAIFQNRQYSISATIADEVLTTRPDYRIALKIAAYSHYKLGEYARAKDLFERLYASSPTDRETAYALGLTNFHLGDYISSSLYFNAAVINGYIPKTELERRLVYNYSLLGDSINGLKVFRFLLSEPDATDDDYQIGIWTAIGARDFDRASEWITMAKRRFPGNDMIDACLGLMEYLRNNRTVAHDAIRDALAKNPRNVIALLTMGKLLFDDGQFKNAKGYFENTIEMNADGNFGEEASKYLERTNYEIALSTTSSGTLLSVSGSSGATLSGVTTSTKVIIASGSISSFR